MDRVVGLKDVKVASAMLAAPDGGANIELGRFYSPSDADEMQRLPANVPGIRHIALMVDNIEAILAKLQRKGTELVGGIQTYEESYKLCYIRGPEGVIAELGEDLK